MTKVTFDQCGCSPVEASHAKCPLTAAPKTEETDMTELERLKAARDAYYDALDAALDAYNAALDAARAARDAYNAALAAQEKETPR